MIRIQKDDKDNWQIVQLPDAEGAFISVNPQDGAVRSLVGGFDFNRNQFNHVTQAWRQPGSGFKPFIYSAALEKGFTPATVINDAPVVVDAALTGGQVWEPKNYDGRYEGPMSLRMALAKSKNMVSIRVLQAIGPQYAQDYITRFGFDADRHPPYLTMALGAGSATPLQMARAFSVFATGGYRTEPYVIQKIVDDRGNVLAQAEPTRAGDESLRVIDARNAFIMDSMMHDVMRYGTAARAMVARPPGSRRQDRHDQRLRRRLVQRLSADPGRHRLGGLRPAEETRPGRDRLGDCAADLDELHEQGAERRPGDVSAQSRGHRHQPRSTRTALQAPDGRPELFFRENVPAEQGPADAGVRTAEDVRNQLF